MRAFCSGVGKELRAAVYPCDEVKGGFLVKRCDYFALDKKKEPLERTTD